MQSQSRRGAMAPGRTKGGTPPSRGARAARRGRPASGERHHMSTKTLLLAAAAAAALLGWGTTPAWAQDDNCITVVGDESSGEKQSADPADMWSGDDALHVWPHYNRLMNVDSSFNLEPELAESWEASPDGK